MLVALCNEVDRAVIAPFIPVGVGVTVALTDEVCVAIVALLIFVNVGVTVTFIYKVCDTVVAFFIPIDVGVVFAVIYPFGFYYKFRVLKVLARCRNNKFRIFLCTNNFYLKCCCNTWE